MKEPDFIQEDVFKTIIWRTGQATGQVGGEATGEVQRVVIVLPGFSINDKNLFTHT